jgi:hypothetical protein
MMNAGMTNDLVGLVLPKMPRSNDQAYGTYYREGPKHISEIKISS